MTASTSRRPRARWLALPLFMCAFLGSALLVGGVLPWFTPALSLCAAAACALMWRCKTSADAECSSLWVVALLPAFATLCQLIPLPPVLLEWLSPRSVLLRSLVDPDAARRFTCLSLDVPASIYELARSVSLAALVIVGEMLCRSRRMSRLVLYGLVCLGVAQGLISAIHIAQGESTSILGLYPFPRGWQSGLGSFVNRNHAAALLVLTLMVSAGLCWDTGSSSKRRVLGAAIVVQAVALAWSRSRGSLGAAVCAGTLLLTLMLSRSIGRSRALLTALVLMAALGALSVELVPGFADRVHHLWDVKIINYQKVRVWRDALPMVWDFRLTGTGRGAFRSVFPAYRSGDEYVTVPYPASLPLQHSSEYGIPFGLLLWAAAGVFALGLLRRSSLLGRAELAAALGVLGVYLQNLFDFSLELLGVAVPTLSCLAVITGRAWRRHEAGKGARGRHGGRCALIILCVLSLIASGGALWAQGRLLDREKRRIRDALQAGRTEQAEALFQAALRSHPCDFNLALLGAATALLGRAPPQVTLHRVNHVLALHPADRDAHRIAARVLAAMGRRDQAALELRLAFGRGWFLDEVSLGEAAALIGDAALIDIVPQRPNGLRHLISFLDGRGRKTEATAAAYRMRVLDPDGR